MLRMIENASKRAFGGSSGTYNVHALELAAERSRKNKGVPVKVHFLDDTERDFIVDKNAKGSILLDLVFQHLELIEKDYFGLQFSSGDNYLRWLDPSKSIRKQMKTSQCLYFKVKFYVSDPSKLQEEYTRYQLFLQVKSDILEGKLQLPQSAAILLASYIVQAELGDYQADEHGPNYLSDFAFFPEQIEDIEMKISELHKLHKGQTPADAEFNFLDHARRMEMYGVSLHKAKDSKGKNIQIGVTHEGLVIFHNNIRINVFSWSKILKISFKSKHFFIHLKGELSEDYDTLLIFNMETYRSSKSLWKASVEHHTFFRLHSPKVKRKFPLSFGSKFMYSGRTEYQTVSDTKQKGKLEKKFVRSPSKQSIKHQLEDRKAASAPSRPSRPYDNKVTSLAIEPKKAWTEDSTQNEGGFLESRVLSYADEEPSPTSNGPYDTPPYSNSHSPELQNFEEGVVTIILYPDKDGKYGFNVKGAKEDDEPIPIVVSKVGPNTPADTCKPRLSEGDQILQINKNDVTKARRSEVVQLIQEAGRANNGRLMLKVKQNVIYQSEEDYEEPNFLYVSIGGAERSSYSDLEQSILLLEDGLAKGALITNYEMLYRRHPDLLCEESAKPKNINKNRYRDILPYDETRVVLRNGVNGDYINANYVDMPIGTTSQVNRYIATQGPLQTTTDDFWQMIWENDCSLIVMLTTLVERGRAKCHKYWPNLNDTLEVQGLKIKCTHEEQLESFHFRDFRLVDSEDKERLVKHIQYVAWPDHGVPDSPEEFLVFTEKVRELRDEAPMVVHCSAGIGRTGVLVLMETAMCLMEVGEGIYPLEIVKKMREQRAMMIQNASQYKFVCESVAAAYKRMKAQTATPPEK